MRIPEIVTQNKIRDAKICDLFLEGDLTTEEIGGRFGITGRQVRRLLYRNRAVLKLDKEYEKLKRILWLKKQLTKSKDTKKDPADLLDQIRIEIEGNKVQHSGEIKGGELRIINIISNGKPNESLIERLRHNPNNLSG